MKTMISLYIDINTKEQFYARYHGKVSNLIEEYMKQTLNLPEKIPEAEDKEEKILLKQLTEQIRETQEKRLKLENYRKHKEKNKPPQREVISFDN